MYVVLKLIGNLLFFSSDNTSNTLLYKMYDFHIQSFKNIQQARIACIDIKIKHGSSFFARTVIGTRATYINWERIFVVLLILK